MFVTDLFFINSKEFFVNVSISVSLISLVASVVAKFARSAPSLTHCTEISPRFIIRSSISCCEDHAVASSLSSELSVISSSTDDHVS